jgi:branched-subunit amino acid ABC-type transport system permease component
MSKTLLWIGNTLICGLLASFFAIMEHEEGPWPLKDLIGSMAEAVGTLVGGLIVGYIATRFMKEATDKSKNVAYFTGVLLWSVISVFSTISG